MLEALKFPVIFIKWIMACVTSAKFTINLNEQDGQKFKGGRGLRQGDPVSPLLFVISMEHLSRVMKKTSKQPGFKYHPSCKQLELTHLMFVDDLMMFCKADVHTLQLFMTTLQEFNNTAGLQVISRNHRWFLEDAIVPFKVYACK